MLRIRVSPEAAATIRAACVRAGVRETGGMLLGEHIAEDEFRVVEATTHAVGRFASFVRVITDSFAQLERFFRRTRHDYTRFNYLGEWHSHPSFTVHPSGIDDETMQHLVEASQTRALFVVLVIVRLDADTLQTGAWAYFPSSPRRSCTVAIDS